MEELDWNSIQNQVETFVAEHPDWVAYGAIGLVLLTVLWIIVRANRQRKRKQYAPEIIMTSFQLSPMGKDAFVKIQNQGEPAYLKKVEFRKRYDLKAKSGYQDTLLEKGKTYNLLLESRSSHRIQPDFLLEITFSDMQSNLYSQRFDPATMKARKMKKR